MLSEYYHGEKFNYYQTINLTNFYNDLNLIQMQKFAERQGVILTSYFAKWTDFLRAKIKNPLICQIRYETKTHFIVIYRKAWNRFLIANPQQKQLIWIKKEELEKIYTGIVLVSEGTVKNFAKLQKLQNLFYWQGLLIPLLVILFMSLLITVFVVLNQFLLKIVIDELLLKKIDESLLIWFLAFGVVFISKTFLEMCLKKMQLKIEVNYKQWWNNKFFAKVNQMNYLEHQRYSTGQLLERYQQFNEVLGFYFPFSFLFLENILVILISISILMLVNSWMVMVAVFFAFISTFIGGMLIPWKNKIEKQKIEQEEQFTQTLVHGFEQQQESQRRNLQHLNQTQLRFHYSKIKNVFLDYQNFNFWKDFIYQFLGFTCKLLIIYFLLRWTKNNVLSPGSFIFLFSLTNNIVERSSTLINNFFYGKRIQKLKVKTHAFLESKKENVKPRYKIQSKSTILLHKLNFAYDDVNWIWKKSLTFDIQNNLLISGLSGSGKTTFLKIFHQDLKAQRGYVVINQKKIHNINKEQWQENIVYISANSSLYSGTVLENILNFRRDENVLKIWEKHHIEKWLKEIDIKPEMMIEKNSLSNGQRQMVVFLSLWFSSAPFVLIDEGLNSLSSALKEKILKDFLKHNPHKLIFFATHDLNLKKLFSQKIQLS